MKMLVFRRLVGLCTVLVLALAAGTGSAWGANPGVQGTVVAWGSMYAQTNVPPGLTNVIAIAAGYNHTLAVKADGTVVGWGDGSLIALQPGNLANVVDVAVGSQHCLALRRNGTVVAWGNNSALQTNVPAGLSGVKAIAAGEFHSMALLSNGTVTVWGSNNSGQWDVPWPMMFPVVAIAAGANHCLALQSSGQVLGWGQNNAGQANNYGPGITAIAAGADFSLALSEGVVYGWGGTYYGQTPPPALSGITAIAAGNSHGLALRTNRKVTGWGDNTGGQRTIPTWLTNVVAISAGRMHSVALKVDPLVILTHPQSRTNLIGSSATFSVMVRGSGPVTYQWFKGGMAIGGATGPSYTIDSVQLSHGGVYTVGVANPLGTLVSSNALLTVHSPPQLTSQPQDKDVGVGWEVSFSVSTIGTTPLTFRWQLNNTNVNLSGANSATVTIQSAQLSHAGNYRVIVTNQYGGVTSEVAVLTVHPVPEILVQPQGRSVLLGSSVALNVTATHATTYQWSRNGQPLPGATQPTYTMDSVQATDAGDYQVAVSNAYGGLLSAVATISILTPTNSGVNTVIGWGEQWIWNGSTYIDLAPPASLPDVAAVASGMSHTLALSTDQTVVGWGDNTFGQAATPGDLSGVLEIAAGAYHSLALKSDGTVVAWGQDDFDQASVPGGLSGVRRIAAGGYHSLALRNNGTVAGWGKSSAGQTVPSPAVGNSNFVALAAGLNHSLGVRSNSTVGAWGANEYRQAAVPIGLSNVMAVAGGDYHSLALRSNGTVVAWGDNSFGQTNVPSGLSNVVAIACGANYCLALQRNGRLASWGQDNFGQAQTAGLKGILCVAGGGAHGVALKKILLQLQAGPALTNGMMRIVVRKEDGAGLTAAKLGQVDMLATTNLSLNGTNWAVQAGVIYTNGSLRLDVDPNAPAGFFMIRER